MHHPDHAPSGDGRPGTRCTPPGSRPGTTEVTSSNALLLQAPRVRISPDPVTSDSEFIYAYCGRDCSLLAWGAHMRTRVHVPTVLVTLRLASQNALARRCDALGALARRMIARAVRPTVLSTQYSVLSTQPIYIYVPHEAPIPIPLGSSSFPPTTTGWLCHGLS